MSGTLSIHIAGPCSAETREQVLLTAGQLKEACGELPFVFRAGVWKPRTSPHSFQGAGSKALDWLREVQQMGIPVATEVATPKHIDAASQAQIDYLWIGARTSANPIAMQELADALKQQTFRPKAVLIKNPVQNDAQLWIGNIERFEQTGIPVMAVHRGCGHKPCWSMAHALRQARPDIPLIIDPSHMGGEAEQILPLLNKAAELGYNGTMTEVHHCPEEARSDAKQQITPNTYRGFIEVLSRFYREQSEPENDLNWLRAEIDEADDLLWQTIAERMDISRRIGAWKQANGVAPLQPERFRQIVEKRIEWAQEQGLPKDFVEKLFDIIHAESLRQQQ